MMIFMLIFDVVLFNLYFSLAIISLRFVLFSMLSCSFICNSNFICLELKIIYSVVLISIYKIVNVIFRIFLICRYEMHVSNNIWQIVKTSKIKTSWVFARVLWEVFYFIYFMYFINDFFVDSALQFDQRISIFSWTLMMIKSQIIENKDDELHFFHTFVIVCCRFIKLIIFI